MRVGRVEILFTYLSGLGIVRVVMGMSTMKHNKQIKQKSKEE